MRRTLRAVLVAALLAAPGAAAEEPRPLGDPERGRELFVVYCASCHGPTGGGDGPVGRNLEPPLPPLAPGRFTIDADGDGQPGGAEDLRLLLVRGGPAYGGSRLMGGYRQLEDEPQDLEDLVAFVQSLPRR